MWESSFTTRERRLTGENSLLHELSDGPAEQELNFQRLLVLVHGLLDGGVVDDRAGRSQRQVRRQVRHRRAEPLGIEVGDGVQEVGVEADVPVELTVAAGEGGGRRAEV